MHSAARASLQAWETNKSRLNQRGGRIRIGRAAHTGHQEERRQEQAAGIPVADPTHLHQQPIIHRLKGLTASWVPTVLSLRNKTAVPTATFIHQPLATALSATNHIRKQTPIWTRCHDTSQSFERSNGPRARKGHDGVSRGAWRLVLGLIFSILSSTFFNVLLDDFVCWVSLLRYSQEQGVSYCIWAGLFLEMEILPTSDSDAEKLGEYVFSLEGKQKT